MPMKFVSGLASAAASVSRGEQEADGDDDVGVALEGGGDVLGVVGLGHRLDVVGLEAEALLGRRHALVGVLVERAVVDLADVGDEADGEALRRLDAGVQGLLAEVVERDLGGGLVRHRRRGLVAGGGRRRRCSSSSSPQAAVTQAEGDETGEQAQGPLVQGSLQGWGLGTAGKLVQSRADRRAESKVPWSRRDRLAGSRGGRSDSAHGPHPGDREDRRRGARPPPGRRARRRPPARSQPRAAGRGRRRGPRADHPLGHHRHRRRAGRRARTSSWWAGPASASTTSTPTRPPRRA